jgi:hypothetical protein
MERESLYYLLRHVFLPPQLPQETDRNDAKDYLLTERVYHILKRFGDTLHAGAQPSLTNCVSMLGNLLASRTPSGLDSETLNAQLSSMANKGSGALSHD